MKKLQILIVLITLVGVLPSLLQYGTTLMVGDFSGQEIPFIVETKRMFSSGVPFWSWRHSIGDSFIPSYSFYTLTSPFVWINCLFPYKYLYFSITLTFFLKMMSLGAVAYLYFRKMSLGKDLSVLGSLMFTFSSFTVSNLTYYHFVEPMIVFVILLIAIERFLREERHAMTVLALSSFLVCFVNFYFAFGSLLFALIYTLFRMTSDEISVSARKVMMGVGSVLLGVMLSSIILLPTVMHLYGNPRMALRHSSILEQILRAFERTRTLFQPKILESPNPFLFFQTWGSNAANVPVVGFVMAAVYIWREKGWLKWLTLTSLAIFVTPLNGIFTGFTDPTYSRWAYALVLMLILCSLKALDGGLVLGKKVVWSYFVLALLVVLGNYVISLLSFHHAGIPIGDIREGFVKNAIIVGILLLSLALLEFYRRKQTLKRLQNCVIILSIVYIPMVFLMRSETFFRPLGKLQFCNEKLYLLDSDNCNSGENFRYRTDYVTKGDGNTYLNLSLITSRPALTSYSSVHNEVVERLFNSVSREYKKNGLRVKVDTNAVSYDALMSVKDIVVYRDSLRKEYAPRALGARILANEKYAEYANRYYIPMGFCYDTYIDEAVLDSLLENNSPVDIPLQMLSNLAVSKSDIPLVSKYLKKSTYTENLSVDSLHRERSKHVCSYFEGDTRGFKAKIEMDRDNLVFFSVPADKGFTATVDGETTRIYNVNLGLSAVVVPMGKHDVEFSFMPAGLPEGASLSAVAMLLLVALFVYERKQTAPSS